MQIEILDSESLMVLITCQSPFTGVKVTEIIKDIKDLKAKGAMGFIFDLTKVPFIGQNGVVLFSVLGAEAVMGNDLLRLICPNPRFKQLFELSGLNKVVKYMNDVDEAIDDLRNVLFIEDALPESQLYRRSDSVVEVDEMEEDETPEPMEDDMDAKVAKALQEAPASAAPPPASEAKPGEELGEVFVVELLHKASVGNSFLLPKGQESEDALTKELKHITFRMKDAYESFNKKASEILASLPEEFVATRAYPVREWAVVFKVTQGKAPKTRNLCVIIGANVHKKAKSLSYSSKGALDQFDFECYFCIGVHEQCTLYGQIQDTRDVAGWSYHMFQPREPPTQTLINRLMNHLLEATRKHVSL